jgi:peptidoglycan hydrolase-like protein with peptidoglycan-binding domain
MKRVIFLVSATALVLGFSALSFAQQSPSPEKKQTTASAKTMPKAMKEHKGKMESLKLSKDEIMALQNALSKANGYKGQANGMLDTATKHAIREYQTTNKLKITGEPNAETLQHLGVSYKAMSAKHPMEKKTEPAPTSKNPPKSNQH